MTLALTPAQVTLQPCPQPEDDDLHASPTAVVLGVALAHPSSTLPRQVLQFGNGKATSVQGHADRYGALDDAYSTP